MGFSPANAIVLRCNTRSFQAVSCALHLMAFAESMGDLMVGLDFNQIYVEKTIAVVVLLLLLGEPADIHISPNG